MGYLENLKYDKSLVEDLILIPGISGYEDKVREYLYEVIVHYSKPRIDKAGNLIAELGGKGPRIVIAAHMDELGLLVSGIDENGLIAFRKIGGIDDSLLQSRHVIIHGAKGPIPGIIGVIPRHLRRTIGEDEGKPKHWHELRIDIGAESREDALKMGVEPLSPVTFRKHITYMGNDKYLASRAVDDRTGCAALIELVRLIGEGVIKPRAELVVAWTVEEELGLIGARGLARSLEPDLFIAVDTITCCHPAITGNTRLGYGPVIRAMDSYYIAPPRLVKKIYNIGIDKGLPLQLATAGGTTDAAAFQFQGIPSIAISAPIMNTHSLVEKIHLKDYENWIKLLAAVVESGLRL